MRIKRATKIFSRQRENPPEDFFQLPKDLNVEEFNMSVEVSYDKQYDTDIKSFGPIDKKKIHDFVKDIKAGYIDSDGTAGGDTHYLSDYSKPTKYLTFSKSITTSDRMVYSVKKPEVDFTEKLIKIKIHIRSLLGHTNPFDKQKSYSEVIC